MVRSIILKGSLIALGQVFDRLVGLGLFHQFEDLEVGYDHVVCDLVPYLIRLLQVLQSIILAVLDAFLETS